MLINPLLCGLNYKKPFPKLYPITFRKDGSVTAGNGSHINDGAIENRILVNHIHILKQQGLKYGLASLCIGGGMGVAVLVRNTDIE